MTVDEYANEFYRLARFALKLVPNEAYRAWKFKEGLRRDIRSRMSGREWTNVKETYETALRYEKDLDKERKKAESKLRKRSGDRSEKR